MIFYDHISDLRYFFESTITLRSKTKTIAADNSAGMDGDMFSQDTVMINLYTWVKHRVVIDASVIANIDPGKYLNVISDKSVFTHIAECANKNVVSDYSGL